jgi:ABC-type ATPase with predicted acetyltransferase domain
VLPRSSVTSHLQLHERPNIIEPDEDDELVDQRLLDHLAEMSQALGRTYHGAWTREEQVRAIMSRELLTVGYGHIKAKMNRGDTPLSDLHYGSARQC